MVKPTNRNIRVDPLSRAYTQYLILKSESERTAKEAAGIKTELLKIVSESKDSYKDDKGSQYLDLIEPIIVNGKQYSGMKRERRTSKVLDLDKAENLLEAKGLYNRERIEDFRNFILNQIELFDQPVNIMFDISLDQNEIYIAYQRDQITEEELDDLFEVEETFAFITIK